MDRLFDKEEVARGGGEGVVVGTGFPSSGSSIAAGSLSPLDRLFDKDGVAGAVARGGGEGVVVGSTNAKGFSSSAAGWGRKSAVTPVKSE